MCLRARIAPPTVTARFNLLAHCVLFTRPHHAMAVASSSLLHGSEFRSSFPRTCVYLGKLARRPTALSLSRAPLAINLAFPLAVCQFAAVLCDLGVGLKATVAVRLSAISNLP